METTQSHDTTLNHDSFGKKIDSMARRALDFTAAAASLLFLWPVFCVIACLIKRDTPGPVFFHGPRLGRKGKVFSILKFRTMYENEESYAGPRLTTAEDVRVTPVGRWLRDTKVNELPQLWNVLKGEMSLVGPRPEDPEIASAWPPVLRNDLLAVRPGITSPATITFRDEETLMGSENLVDNYLKTILPDKLRLDRNYLRNRSLLTDLDVLFMTLLYLLPRLRKHQVPETALYWGPIAKFVSRVLNWFIIDTVTAFLAITLSAMLWRLNQPFNIGLASWIAISIAVGLFFSVFNAIFGLHRIQWRRAATNEVVPLTFSTLLATLLLIFFDHALPPYTDLPLAMLGLTGLLSFGGFTITRYRERLLTGLATFWLGRRRNRILAGERVLLVGAGDNSELAIWFLTHSEFARLFSIVGIVDDDPRKQGLVYDGFRVLGTSRDLPALVEKFRVDLTLFTINNIDWTERQRILRNCQTANTRVVIFPDVMANLGAYFQNATTQPAQLQSQYSSIGDPP